MHTAADITLSLCKTIDVVFEGERQISPCQDRTQHGDERLPGSGSPGGFSVRDCSFVWEEAKRTNKVSYLGDCFVKTTQQLFNHLNHGTLTTKEKATIVNFLLESGAIKMKIETARLTIPEAAPDTEVENNESVMHHSNGTYSIIPKEADDLFVPPQQVQNIPGMIPQNPDSGKTLNENYAGMIPQNPDSGKTLNENYESSTDIGSKIPSVCVSGIYSEQSQGQGQNELDNPAVNAITEQVSFMESVTYPDARPQNEELVLKERTDAGIAVKKEPDSENIVYMCGQEDNGNNVTGDGLQLPAATNEPMKVIRPHSSQMMSAAEHLRKIRQPRKLNLSFRKFGINKRKYTLPPSGEKLFLCEFCTAGFDTKMKLTLHLRTHYSSAEKIYECKDCKKKFTDESSYVVHQQFHIQTGETPFQCEVCGKAFKFKNRLSAHMRTHTGEKPFECTLCNKRFNDRSNLNAHRRIHSGEKPYACMVCGARFGHRSNLRKHTKRHHVDGVGFVEQ